MIRSLLSFELIDGPLLVVCAVVAALAAVAVLIPRRRRILLTVVVGASCALAMYVAARILDALQTFDGPLPTTAALWAAAAAAGAGIGIVGVLRAPWTRRVAGVVCLVASLLSGFLGVNAAYGVTHNLAAILGVQALDPSSPPPRVAPDGADPSTLYQRWSPPADMPATGTVTALTGDSRIPSGDFRARDAALYLPPAALVADPPALPLLVFMMGQPGSPDPTNLVSALDSFAASHRGLAPIAIVVDQLGARDVDPACADSSTYGPVSTYVNTLVPRFASERLNVIDDARYRIIAGYSNGGSCALAWGAQHPDVWGQLLDVSGNEFPGSEHPDDTIARVFGGDAERFRLAQPAVVMAAAAPGTYAGHTAVFTWGGKDTYFGPGQARNAAAAQAAGFTVRTETIDGAEHGGPALDEGIAFGIETLAPVVGLAPPPG